MKRSAVQRIFNAAAAFRRPPMARYTFDGRCWLTVRNDPNSDRAEMVIDGAIGGDPWTGAGTSSAQFRKALDAIQPTKPIRLKINSPGGSCGDSLAIALQIKERGNVTCRVQGYALSAASVVAVSGVRCEMPAPSILMIHEPWAGCEGTAEDGRKFVAMLEAHAKVLAQYYADAAEARGVETSPEKMRELMLSETWLDSDEASEQGFADPLEDDDNQNDADVNDARARIAALDLSRYPKAPANVLNMAKPISRDPLAAVNPKQKTAPANDPGASDPIIMNRVQMIALLTNWGVNVDLKATDEVLTALIAQGKPRAAPTAPAAAQPETMTVPAAEFAALRASLANERTKRIEAAIEALGTRVPNSEKASELVLCLANEDRLKDVLAKRPTFQAGEAVGGHYELEVLGTVFDQVLNMKPTKQAPAVLAGDERQVACERFEFRKAHWGDLMAEMSAKDARLQRHEGPPPRFNSLSNPNVKYTAMTPQSDGSGRYLPVNASTYQGALVVDQLADGAITALVNVLCPLRIFTMDFMPLPFSPLNTMQIRLVKTGAGSSQQFAKVSGTTSDVTSYAVDYEASADHDVENVAVTMNEWHKPFFVTSQEIMSGMRIEYLANRAMLEFGTDILTSVLELLNTTSFTAGPSNGSITAHYGNFTWNSASSSVNDMAILRGQLGKSGVKNAILDPMFWGKLITIPVVAAIPFGVQLSGPNTMRGIMGWDEIAETSAWGTGQGSGGSTASWPQPICGFACHPQAIAVGARLPLLPPEGVPGNTLVQAQVTIPGLGMTVAVMSWFSLRYRQLFGSYGAVFGSAAGDLTAGCLLKSLGV